MPERENPFGPVPEWKQPADVEPRFTEKATPVDPRTEEEFKEDWENHRQDVYNIKHPENAPKSKFQKAVESTPARVPEAWLTSEERDVNFGGHPLTRHEMDELEDQRPN